MSLDKLSGFQRWLYLRKAHDNPRGDAIRDYRSRVDDGFVDDVAPDGTENLPASASYAARREIRKLVQEWRHCVE